MRAFTSPRIEQAVEPLFQLLQQVDEQGPERHFVLVPDRYTQTFEEQILHRTNKKVTFFIEVFSFSRLLYRLKKREDRNFLSREQGIMVLKKLIFDHQEELLSYRRSALTRHFAGNLYDLLQKLRLEKFDFKRAGALPLREPLRRRLSDIALLHQAYQDFLSDGWVDAPDLLDELPGLCDQLKQTRIYLAGFSQFSGAERRVISAFLKQAAGVDLFCTHREGAPEALNEVFLQMQALCKESHLPFEEIPVPSASDPLRDGLMSFLWDNRPSSLPSERFSLFAAESREAQMKTLAQRIRLLTHTGQVRYREIALLLPSPQTAKAELMQIFSEYEIPCFFDRKIPLRTHPAARFALALLSAAGQLDDRNVLRLVKNPCFGATFEQIDAFENAVLALGTKYDRFFLPFPEDLGEEAETLRKKLVSLLDQAALPSRARAQQFSDRLAQVTDALSDSVDRLIEACLAKGEQTEADFLDQGRQKLSLLLTRLGEIFGSDEMSLEEYTELFESGCEAELSLTPSLFDAVMVGDLRSAFFLPVRYLFLADLQLGFPPAAEAGGLLSDRDLGELQQLGKLPFDSGYQNAHSRLAADQLLLKSCQSLFCCYLPGEGPLPEKLNAVFSLMPDAERSDSRSERLEELDPFSVSGFTAAARRSKSALLSTLLEQYAAAKASQPFNRDLMDGLYGLLSLSDQGDLLKKILFRPDPATEAFEPKKLFFLNGRASVSSLETFFSCPFRHFLQYGLRLRQRPESRLNRLDLGNLLHAVAELYVKRQAFENPVEKEVDRIFGILQERPEFSAAFANSENDDQLQRLKAECVRFLTEISRQFTLSDFYNLATEAAFGMEDGPFPSAEIPNCPVRLYGKIDRIDVLELSGRKFARVIDYKSGNQTFSQSEVLDGVKLQLLIYLCVLRANSYLPAGAYYFPIRDRFSEDKNPYQLKGPTLRDEAVLKASDHNIPNSGSSFLQVKLSAWKNRDPGELRFSEQGSLLFTAEQFDQALNLVLDKARAGVQAILEGQADIAPYKNTCDVCDFLGICQNYRREHSRPSSKGKLFDREET